MSEGHGSAARTRQTTEGVEESSRPLADIIPQLVWTALPDGSVDYCNRRWLEYTGFTADQAAGWGWRDAVHPADVAPLTAFWNRVLAGAAPAETETRLRGADGGFRWFLVRVAPFADERGRIVKWCGTSTDIDASKRAEQGLRRVAADERRQRDLLLDIVSAVPGVVWEASLNTDTGFPHVDYVSPNVAGLLGYTTAELLSSPDFWLHAVHEEDRERTVRRLTEILTTGIGGTVEVRSIAKDGRVVWLESQIAAVSGASGGPTRVCGVTTDVSGRKRSDELRQGEHRVLEMIASGTTLREVLATLAHLVEAQCEGLLCSILLLDKDGARLRHGAAPSLPGFYNAAIDGVEIGPQAGSCGTAAYRREAVIVTDILSDPLWQDYRELASQAGLRACWSTPILTPSGRVLGTFAMYYREVRSPGPLETQLIEVATRLAGIGIERCRAQGELRRSEAYLAEGQRLTHTGSFAWNVATHENAYWSAEHFRIFGLDPDKDSSSFAAAVDRIHPEDRARFAKALEDAVREKADVDVDWRITLADGTTKHLHSVGHPVMGPSGEVVELVGTCMDVTEQHQARAALEQAFEEIQALRDQLYRENLALRDEVDRASMFEEIVGSSAALQAVLSRLAKVAPTDSTVLITGETGTGKELVARAIHKRSQRSGRAFVSVNCAALPPSLVLSELFGHEKGAFTGAMQRRLGRFELADGGTIFLDEVGELPPDTQVALLRVLQERQIERLGGTRPVSVDVRVIAATNRDLEAAAEAGTFRIDLFYRLNVFPIEVPPLRERREDILMLLEYFVGRYARRAGKNIGRIDKRTLDLLQSYDWPGNIRELQNVVERSVILCPDEVFFVDEAWLPKASREAQRSAGRPVRLNEKLSNSEREIVEAALAESGGRVAGPSGAATRLGIPPSTLESKIKALGIRKSQYRQS
jgi:PAS domain S-box-containing protein